MANTTESKFKVTRGWPLGYALETAEYLHADAADELVTAARLGKGHWVYRDATTGEVRVVETDTLDGTFTGPVGMLVEGPDTREGFSSEFTEKAAILWGNFIVELPIDENKAHAPDSAGTPTFSYNVNDPVTVVGGLVAPIDNDFSYTTTAGATVALSTANYQAVGWVVAYDATNQIVTVQVPGGYVN